MAEAAAPAHRQRLREMAETWERLAELEKRHPPALILRAGRPVRGGFGFSLNGIGIRKLHDRYEELRVAYLALINLMSFVLTRIADLYEPHGHVACGKNGRWFV